MTLFEATGELSESWKCTLNRWEVILKSGMLYFYHNNLKRDNIPINILLSGNWDVVAPKLKEGDEVKRCILGEDHSCQVLRIYKDEVRLMAKTTLCSCITAIDNQHVKKVG